MEMTQAQREASQALIEWAEANDIRAPEFSRATGYTYDYSYKLLTGAKAPTDGVVSKILSKYDPLVAQSLALALEGQTQPTD